MYFSNARIIALDSDTITERERIKEACIRYFSIDTLDNIGVSLVEELDNLALYYYEIKCRISAHYRGSLLINSNNHRGLFLPVVDSRLFKSSHNRLFICGTQQYRTYGYFNIYSVFEDSVVQVFASENLCKNGLPVRNASLDCYSYEPVNLKLITKDLNGDGVIDFVFSGFLNSYCQGLERGIGRLDEKPPLKTTPINIVFESKSLDNDIDFFWQISDTSICTNIRK